MSSTGVWRQRASLLLQWYSTLNHPLQRYSIMLLDMTEKKKQQFNNSHWLNPFETWKNFHRALEHFFVFFMWHISIAHFLICFSAWWFQLLKIRLKWVESYVFASKKLLNFFNKKIALKSGWPPSLTISHSFFSRVHCRLPC